MKRFYVILFILMTFTIWGQSEVTTESPVTKGSSIQSDFGLRSEILRKLSVPTQNLSSIPANYISALSTYVPTPGDIYALTLSVFENGEISVQTIYFQMDDKYQLDLPILGKVSFKNKSLFQLQQLVSDKLKSVLPVTSLDFRLNTPALFDVFIFGGVSSPGVQRLNSTFTLADVIAMAGGLRTTGSYRNIIIERNKEKKSYDIAKYFTNADFNNNPTLKPGDIVQIMPAEIIVKTNATLNYPGSYELISGETIEDLIRFGGDFKVNVSCHSANIIRQKNGETFNIYVAAEDFKTFTLENNDTVSFISTTRSFDPIIVDGAVYGSSQISEESTIIQTNNNRYNAPQRISIPYSNGITVLAALDITGGPTPLAVAEKAFILKKGSVEKIPVDVKALWKTRDLSLDKVLEPGDRLVVPLEQQVVFVGGEVNNPNAIPFNSAYTVFDYVKLAGGYTINAQMKKFYLLTEEGKRVEIPRDYQISPGEILYIEKNFARLSSKAFNDVLVYTGFVSSLVATASSIMSLAINVRNWQRN